MEGHSGTSGTLGRTMGAAGWTRGNRNYTLAVQGSRFPHGMYCKNQLVTEIVFYGFQVVYFSFFEALGTLFLLLLPWKQV